MLGVAFIVIVFAADRDHLLGRVEGGQVRAASFSLAASGLVRETKAT